MTRNNQQGFAHVVGVVLIVLVAAVIAFVGWKVAGNQDTATENGSNQTASQQAEPPQIQSSSDLEAAEAFLAESDIDSQLDTSEIDSALNEQ